MTNSESISIEKYRSVVGSSMEAIFLTSPDGRIHSANSAACTLFGYSEEEIITKGRCGLIDPTDPRLPLLLSERESTGKARGELTFIKNDGSRFIGEISAALFSDTNNQVLSSMMIRDLSKRKQMENSLRESEEKLRSILETMTEGVALNECIFDEQGNMIDYRILEVNKAFYSISDFQEGMVIGNVASELYGMSHEVIKSFWETHRNQKNAVQTEFSSPLSNRCFLVSTSPFANNKFVTSFFDITERKEIDAAHYKSQKLESLGFLAGGIAHDFNNLMGGIFGYIDLAKEESPTQKGAQYLEKALQTMERAKALTAQLLTFAKGGAPILTMGPLSPFVQDTARTALGMSTCTLRCDTPEDLWHVRFDRNQIAQVIDNIVQNAIQAMPANGTLALAVRNISFAEKEHLLLAKGDYVHISLTDNGCGIPEKVLPHIFDPFFTTKKLGHGLGLSTCHSIISQHGGAIDVDSIAGSGTTFHLYLQAEKKIEKTVPSNNEVYQANGTILIMDDEEIIRETTGAILSSLGYTPVCTENGKDALEYFSKENSSLIAIILDLTIPHGMGGKATIARIRAVNNDIPVFVASGYADDPVMKNPTQYGFTASICKPFRRAHLAEMLAKHLTQKN